MSAVKRLNPLDWFFLAAESKESMMHVGSLAPFSAPPDAPPDFLRKLMEELKHEAHVYAPWNLKLKNPAFIASPLQGWVEDKHFDVEYHIRRSALPSPGDERELGILVSRLHSNPIDFHRPPWEVHFIEGLEGGRFALYFKVHHALVDGYTGAKLMERGLSANAKDRDEPLFFARKPPEHIERAVEAKAPTMEALMSLVREQAGASRNISKALMRIVRPGKDKTKALVAPMSSPKSIINQKISRNRRFATQQFPVDRLKRVAKAYDGTINDIVLALSAAGLRKLLGELGELPAKPLTAMLPVNIRPKDDPGGGNAVGSILATLATDVEDPVERFRTIIASTREAKAQLSGMTKMGIMEYSALLMAPMMLSQVPGAIGRVRPAFNVVISNVPGPKNTLYFRGWKMEAYYPLSIPIPGYGLNITVVSYIDTLNFGFIGCRDTVPHLQRLAVYAREALEELEAAAP